MIILLYSDKPRLIVVQIDQKGTKISNSLKELIKSITIMNYIFALPLKN